MIINKDHISRSNTKKEGQEHSLDKTEQGKQLDQANQAQLVWTRGSKNNISVQTIVVDGAWKRNARTNQWQAAIAWKNTNNDPKEEAATKIFANSPE